METTTISQFSGSKKLKSSQLEHIINGDRISSLPDSILHHILSYRSLHYAVQTSVLSRRWRYLWTSLPTLNFNSELSSFPCTISNRPDGLKDFVDQALLQRDNNSNVQRFELDYGETVHLNSWILYVLQRNVQEICLNLSVDRPFQLPHCLFTCSTLTSLELNFWGTRRNKLSLPADLISLPALKTLILASLLFEDSDAINYLFSKCPLLESLTLLDCEMHHTHIIISLLKLKHLVIDVCDGINYDNPSPSDGSLKLYAPNLIYFCCQDHLFKNYLLEDLSSLVKAKIHLDIKAEYSDLAEEKQTADENMMKFLRDVQHVKALTLSASVIQVVSGAYALVESNHIQFCSLRCLKIESVQLSKDCIHAIAYLLKISPNVETLSLSMDEYEDPFLDQPKYPYWDEKKFPPTSTEDYWESGLSLQCMLYHLKSVEIRGILGCVNEVKFLEILLEMIGMSLLFRSKVKPKFLLAAESLRCMQFRMSNMNGSTDVDRLSTLPEIILHHILSFLNMKQVGKTSVLSKRWRNLWASLPFLNFDKELVESLNSTEEKDSTALKDFVHQVLLQRDNTCIQKFHLYCPKVNRLCVWTIYLRYHNVQEISFVMGYRHLKIPELLPLRGFFTCTTSLKVLELKINHHLWCIIPHTINLPVLQTLVLDGLKLGKPTFYELFYACPILESLTIKNCRILFSHLNISSTKLRQLVIDNDCRWRGLPPYAVKIYAPNLLSFCCKDKMLIDYSLENLSSLVKADILLGRKAGLSAKYHNTSVDESSATEKERLSAEKEERYTKSTMEVLRAVQKVTTLTLSGLGSIFQAFSESNALQRTQFCNLRCLKVCANNLKNSNWLKGVTCLLKISPNIEKLSLTGEMSDAVDVEDYEEAMYDSVDVGDYYQEAGLSLGNLKHLKFVEFKNVSGGVNELKFLENLLKNAVGLEKLLIVFLPMRSHRHRKRFGQNPSDRGRHREKFGQKILGLPTVSSSLVAMLIF